MTVRNWMNQISVKHPYVYKVFYVTEWDKGDYRNSHTHSLIASYKDITYKDFNDSVSFAVGDWQSVYDNKKIKAALNYQFKSVEQSCKDFSMLFLQEYNVNKTD